MPFVAAKVCFFVVLLSIVQMTTTKMTTPFVAISFPAQKGEKRFLNFSPRLEQLRELAQQALGLDDFQSNQIFGYGCWCGIGGMGRPVDNFDL